MAKEILYFRIDKIKIERLRNVAKLRNTSYSKLLREKVDEILNNNIDENTKSRIKAIIWELEQPFVFIKTKTGKKFADKEREIRKKIIDKLKNLC